jgi:membrane protein DedA with SNARE-associated domain
MLGWLEWLSALPTPLLYGAIVVAAFAENIFPPLPADTVVALGAFAAARGNGSAFGAWAATMIGNISGAMAMFALGRRIGITGLSTRFPRLFPAEASQRVAKSFRERGLVGLVISRFLPGVRAVVPPVAGAIGLGAVQSAVAMTIASGVWYGIVCRLAFGAGENAELLLDRIAGQQRLVGGIALAIAVVFVGVLIWRRRRPDGGP